MAKLFSGIFLMLFFALMAMPAGAVGFQRAKTVDADGRPIAIDLWYPSDAKPTRQTFGPFHPDVAVDGAVSGRKLPLVLFSHGTGGSALSHYDTAMALAAAGFVVVTFDHPGDNYGDQTSVGSRRNLIDGLGRRAPFLITCWAIGNGMKGSTQREWACSAFHWAASRHWLRSAARLT